MNESNDSVRCGVAETALLSTEPLKPHQSIRQRQTDHQDMLNHPDSHNQRNIELSLRLCQSARRAAPVTCIPKPAVHTKTTFV